MSDNKHIGPSLDDFLEKEGILEEATAEAKKKLKPTGRYCGNEGCSASTGICDSITFGSGELSNNGYWERPCVICAAVAVRFGTYPEDRVWPDISNHRMPDWAGQATPGAQLTCVRSAIEGTLANIAEGITPPEKVKERMAPLLEQLKKLEQHLKHRAW